MVFDLPAPEIIANGVEPDAALAFWQARAAMTREQALALPEHEKWRAFYVTGLTQHDQIQTVKDAIEAALKNGETIDIFKTRIKSVIESTGWDSYRIENIFRTNMQTAYSAGRYAKMQAVKSTRPYWQYITIEDKRRRPSHAILHGMVYHADHEFWGTNFPPNGFRCRCDVRTLSKRQVEAQGLEIQSTMPGDSQYTDPKTGMEYHVARPGADDGFRNSLGRDWMQGLLERSVEKLENSDSDLAGATVRKLVQGGFEEWTKQPQGNFPLAVLAAKDAASIGSTATVACLSAETWNKQQKRHPELTLADYALAQDAVEYGEKYPQDAKNTAFVLNQPGGVVVIVKATKIGDELYVTSLRRMSRDEEKRERIIQQLKK